MVLVGQIRVALPETNELPALLEKIVNNKGNDLTLLFLVFTEPSLRFRLCVMAHLLEVAFAEVEKAWTISERPRVLTGDDLTFVMETLRDFFLDLFRQPRAQHYLRRFFTDMYEWFMQSMSMKNEDDISMSYVPNVCKTIFPCYITIMDEIRPIITFCKKDDAFRYQGYMVFKFLRLSLTDSTFVSAPDWSTEGCRWFDQFQKTLSTMVYHRFAQSFLRNVVSMTDQLRESAGAAAASLAIKKYLTKLLNLAGPDITLDRRINAPGFWNWLDYYTRLIQVANECMVPSPLPSISWKRGNTLMCLDSMVIHIPNFTPSKIQLVGPLSKDGMGTRNVPYFFVARSPLLKHISRSTMSGMEDGLKIEATFDMTAPTSHRQAQGQGRRRGELA